MFLVLQRTNQTDDFGASVKAKIKQESYWKVLGLPDSRKIITSKFVRTRTFVTVVSSRYVVVSSSLSAVLDSDETVVCSGSVVGMTSGATVLVSSWKGSSPPPM